MREYACRMYVLILSSFCYTAHNTQIGNEGGTNVTTTHKMLVEVVEVGGSFKLFMSKQEARAP